MSDALKQMLDDGSLEPAGVGDDGEPLYRMVVDVCRKLHPEVFGEAYSRFMADINDLWQKGYVNVNFLADDIEVSMTDRTPGADLDERQLQFLHEVERALEEV